MNDFGKNTLDRVLPSATEFFAVFSRFEYALKKCGYFRASNQRNDVQADWDRFANMLGPDFLEQIRNDERHQILLAV